MSSWSLGSPLSHVLSLFHLSCLSSSFSLFSWFKSICWLRSIWTLPDASGCILRLIYNSSSLQQYFLAVMLYFFSFSCLIEVSCLHSQQRLWMGGMPPKLLVFDLLTNLDSSNQGVKSTSRSLASLLELWNSKPISEKLPYWFPK